MSPNPGSWIDTIIGWCVSLLFGAGALYCAASLIESILPTLIRAVGALAVLGIIVGIAIVVIRTVRNQW